MDEDRVVRQAGNLLVDTRVRSVPWRDLVTLRPAECLRELVLPLPWLFLALLAARYSLWVLALAGSFYFFLTGLRLVHDVFHGNLGLRAWGNDVVLLALSLLMLGSMHAVRLTHLQHHRDCLGEGDVEGAAARRGAAGALLLGVIFPIQVHLGALRMANRRCTTTVIDGSRSRERCGIGSRAPSASACSIISSTIFFPGSRLAVCPRWLSDSTRKSRSSLASKCFEARARPE